MRGIDAEGAEQTFHAKRARFVGNNRHHEFADFLVAGEHGEHAHEGHGGGNLALVRAFEQHLEGFHWRNLKRRCGLATRRQVTAKRFAMFFQVHDDGVVIGRFVERHIGDFVVGNRHIETVAEFFQRFHVHFLLLVRGVLRFADGAHAVAFYGLGEDDGRLAFMFRCGGVSGINFMRIVATTV